MPPDSIAGLPVSHATRLVLTWLWIRATLVDGLAFAATTKAAIARLTQQDERSVRRQIDALEQGGHLRSGRVMVAGKWRRGWELLEQNRTEESCSDPPVLSSFTGPPGPKRTEESGFREPDPPVRTGPTGPNRTEEAGTGTRTEESEPDRGVRKNRTHRSGLRGGFGGGDANSHLPTAEIMAPQLQRASTGAMGEVDRLKEWRTYGGDPDGLGPWPKIQIGNRQRDPIRMPIAKAIELVESGVTAIQVHRVVHRLAEAIESGGFRSSTSDDPWRGTLVFSGHFDTLTEDVDRHLAALERRRTEAAVAEKARQEAASTAEGAHDEHRAGAALLEQSDAMRRLVGLAEGEPASGSGGR